MALPENQIKEAPKRVELEQIIEGCRQADNRARRELYERYSAPIYGVLCRYVGRGGQADDLLHDVFISIFTHIDSYRGDGSFEGWCRRIAIRTAIDHLRSKRLDLIDLDTAPTTLTQQSVAPEVLDNINAEELTELIDQLSPALRTMVNLRIVEGYDYRRIADELGTNESTARSQFRRARVQLIELIEQRYK